MPTDSFYKSCITENSFAKEEHKKEIEQEYMRKKSNASSIISQVEEESRAESFKFTDESLDIAEIIGTDHSLQNKSVHSDDKIALLHLNNEWFV